MSASATRRPTRLAGRVFAWTLAALLGVVVLGAGWIGVRGVLAYGHLQQAQSTAASVADDLDDPAAAAAALADLTDDTAAAHALTSDPVWALAEGLPWLGAQLAAVGSVTAAVDEVVGTALTPLIDAASGFSVDALRPRDGAIDVAAFRALQPAAATGAAGVAQAAASVAEIDTSRLIGVLREPIVQAQELLDTTATGADALARASALLPTMLGADGPRNYLLVFQNNSEWRSLGGIVGAMAVIHTEGGRMQLADQGSSSDFRRYDEPVLDLGAEVTGFQQNRPAQWVQNATQVTDFALAGQIVREMWAREKGLSVDGVISIDPVALSYLLEATGPVQLPTGDVLDSGNAVSLLLNDVYRRYERPADQDLFFQVAAATVFETLSSGGADPAALLAGLARAGDERRLQLWNADPLDQAVLDGTTLQGPLPVADAERTEFGVYLNDGTGSKMDYYMSATTTASWCAGANAATEAGLVVTLRNDAPADAASLPDYITGAGVFDVPPGTARSTAYIYLPPGAEMVTALPTGASIVGGFATGEHGGSKVLTWPTDLAPGEEATLTVRAATPRTADLGVVQTPTVYPKDAPQLALGCEIPQ